MCGADEEEKADEDNSRICRCDSDTMALLMKPRSMLQEKDDGGFRFTK